MLIGLLSDAHGNQEAFDEGVSRLRLSGADTIYFLGDAVGYLPGDSVVTSIRERGIWPVLGNHDAALLRGTADPGTEPIHRLNETRSKLSTDNRAFMETWPEQILLESAAGTLLLVHGSPVDPLGGYLYKDTPLDGLAVDADAVFVGQTHRPFVRVSGRTLFVNVGSCGLPRDCGNLGAVCLFDDEVGSAQIMRFDIGDATARALRRCGPVSPHVEEVLGRRNAEGCDDT